MACHPFSDKPLPEPMVTDCNLDPREQIIGKLIHYKSLHTHTQNEFKNDVCKKVIFVSTSMC